MATVSFADDDYFSTETEHEKVNMEFYDVVLPNIPVGQEASADINVHVTTNTQASCYKQKNKARRTFVVIHGITHTAATWKPFNHAFMHSPEEYRPCHILAIDLPGHGKSGLPTRALYGDLSFDDYVVAVKATLAKLNAIGYATPNLIGFSHAGYMLQLVQQSLLEEGSSLRQAYGVKNTIFLASSLPTPLAWDFADSGAGAEFITQFYQFDETLGTHVDIPDEVWPTLWFVNAAGNLVSGAPTPEQVTARGYNTRESAMIVSQLLAVAPHTRPAVHNSGVFAKRHGTRLKLVTYSNDIFISEQDSKLLYQYLTNDQTYSGYILIEDEEAVHDFHISEPEKLLHILQQQVRW